MVPNRIFISHSSRYANEAEQLVSHLESRGLSCWLAPRDIPGASVYAEALVDGIDGADLMWCFSRNTPIIRSTLYGRSTGPWTSVKRFCPYKWEPSTCQGDAILPESYAMAGAGCGYFL